MTTVLAFSIPTASTATGLSKSHLSDAIHRGDLRARKSSRDAEGEPTGKWLILADDLRAYLDSLPEA